MRKDVNHFIMDVQVPLSSKRMLANHMYKQTEDQKWGKYPIIRISVESATG